MFRSNSGRSGPNVARCRPMLNTTRPMLAKSGRNRPKLARCHPNFGHRPLSARGRPPESATFGDLGENDGATSANVGLPRGSERFRNPGTQIEQRSALPLTLCAQTQTRPSEPDPATSQAEIALPALRLAWRPGARMPRATAKPRKAKLWPGWHPNHSPHLGFGLGLSRQSRGGWVDEVGGRRPAQKTEARQGSEGVLGCFPPKHPASHRETLE